MSLSSPSETPQLETGYNWDPMTIYTTLSASNFQMYLEILIC